MARVLPAWERGNPLTSFVLGAYAFGLEESGELGRAEEVGREALAGNPADGWATHALAHVFETANRQEEGIAFLKSTRANWRPAHFMAGHNGWHLGAFLIELGRFDEVVADYDRFAAPKLADDLTLDRVDAASLLWRLELAGVDVGDRWRPVAEAWMRHVDDHVSAFNDLHLALAAARSPDASDVGRVRASLDAYQRLGAGDNHRVTLEVGRALVEGMLAFGAGDYSEAIDALSSARNEAIRIGGSHAQRDIVAQTLIAAAERSGTLASRARPARRARGGPADRAGEGGLRAGAGERGVGNPSPNRERGRGEGSGACRIRRRLGLWRSGRATTRLRIPQAVIPSPLPHSLRERDAHESASLISHSFAAAASSRAAREGVLTFRLAKYSPLTVATSGDEAR